MGQNVNLRKSPRKQQKDKDIKQKRRNEKNSPIGITSVSQGSQKEKTEKIINQIM